jgi:integrase
MARLRGRPEPAARALEFLILAGLRLLADATWEEINWDEMAWEIPGPRMKKREPHNVPLVGRVVEMLSKRLRGPGATRSSSQGRR